MTCRDIIVKELQRLGADGLFISGPWIKCQCTLADIGRDSNTCGFDCTPAKLINGKWVPVEDKPFRDTTDEVKP